MKYVAIYKNGFKIEVMAIEASDSLSIEDVESMIKSLSQHKKTEIAMIVIDSDKAMSALALKILSFCGKHKPDSESVLR